MSKNTGGPAFPTDYTTDVFRQDKLNTGMTLRDYFAAKAMQAAISTAGGPFMFRDSGIEPHIAEMAYGVADAMLAERDK